MDFVYVYDGKADFELRYSLRSLQNIPHDKVFIAGVMPAWAKNIYHIPAPDGAGKLENVIGKLAIICEDKRVSQQFTLMNDDYFFLQSAPYLERYSLGLLSDCRYIMKSGHYYAAALATLHRLNIEKGIPDPLNFEIHYPMVFFKSVLKAIIRLFGKSSYLYRSAYANLFESLSVDLSEDFKIYCGHNIETAFKRNFISTDAATGLMQPFRKAIAEHFPEPCKYEVM